jgi:hypothetical protein
VVSFVVSPVSPFTIFSSVFGMAKGNETGGGWGDQNGDCQVFLNIVVGF